ncbi:MAG: 2-succinyl-5-enolpyruvyl-6-hydroxy-3-cyclohexene-1-carboxylic-acid synthase, partial [Acidimicrobiales bacterium]
MKVDAATAFARAVVDEWARAGVVVAAVAPGSRSAPLALALAGDGRIPIEVFLDERSAAAFALGAAKASARAAVVLTTSGTAAALLHPAVVEARHARVPLLAVTADRPPELRDTGAGQAIDQL